MVILIGDAPPHKKSEGKIASMVKSFSHNGRSHVHAIITRPSGGADIAKTTQRTFRRIARDGRGEALEFEDEGKIMKAVMNLAFGRKNSRSVDEVYRLAEARQKRTSKKAERLLVPSKRKQLLAEFKKAVISHAVIKAILAKPSRAVLELMVDIASKNTFKSAGKHAAAYILRRTLRSVEDPPVDPENGKPMSTRRARGIRREIQRRFK
jgi:ribosomal protein L17